jgi:hypothetical protein
VQKATNNGKVVDAAELSPAIWFGLPLCDPLSYPLNPALLTATRTPVVPKTGMQPARPSVLRARNHAVRGWAKLPADQVVLGADH